VLKTYTYGAFGQYVSETGSVYSPFRFTGREHDELDLEYFRARYYIRETGRFISEDPARFQDGVDLYRYVTNNPVRYGDPTGLKTWRCIKPLHAFGGQGERSGPDLPGNPFYHQYLCVERDGKTVCGGQDQSAREPGQAIWPGTPGIPSKDTKEAGSCKEVVPDDDCVEACLLKGFAGTRPWYGVGPWGTDCQEWSADLLDTCTKKCKVTKK
jgi:RHS repeat-associated protein